MTGERRNHHTVFVVEFGAACTYGTQVAVAASSSEDLSAVALVLGGQRYSPMLPSNQSGCMSGLDVAFTEPPH